MKDRIILHSDLNGFFASVEIMLDPRLRGRAVAVSGVAQERRGIVLAKSEKAKRAGVRTGMVNFEAKRLCPDLIFVRPHYEQYLKYSKLARQIYESYTDRVEPYGIDECFLDVTESGIFGTGEEIAEKIRQRMKEELGLTVSIGISFNKIFAKLGSDMKKPDAVTVISRENFKTRVWSLPVENLIYCGRATAGKLRRHMINTIGDLANAKPEYIKQLLGKNGEELWRNANGLDESGVNLAGHEAALKSVGNGVTCTEDLRDKEEVRRVMLRLAEEVSHRLRADRMKAGGVHIMIKDSMLARKERQGGLEIALRNPSDLTKKAMELFDRNCDMKTAVRALSITAINLLPEEADEQLSLFSDEREIEKHEKLFAAVDELRNRYGRDIIKTAAIYDSEKRGKLKLPGR